MRKRMIRDENGKMLMAVLLKGEKICHCGSVVGIDGNKRIGAGCTKCDPDKSVDPVFKNDLANELDSEVSAMFIHETVDPVEAGDIYKTSRIPPAVFQSAELAVKKLAQASA